MLDPSVRFLRPGELGYSQGTIRLKTILGSCVAVTLWHPETRHAAMCHFLLPENLRTTPVLEGRFGSDALMLLHRHFQIRNTPPDALQAGIYGGGDVTCGMVRVADDSIGHRNVEMARRFLESHGYRVQQEDVRGTRGRTILLFPESGQVEVKLHAHDPLQHWGQA